MKLALIVRNRHS